MVVLFVSECRQRPLPDVINDGGPFCQLALVMCARSRGVTQYDASVFSFYIFLMGGGEAFVARDLFDRDHQLDPLDCLVFIYGPCNIKAVETGTSR